MELSGFHDMIETMKGLDYKEKIQFYQYLLRMAQQARQKFTREDKEEILAYAYAEVDHMLRDIPAAATYKEKATIFVCEDCLMGLVMHLSGSPDNIPEDVHLKIRGLVEMVESIRRIETTLDGIFQKETVTGTDMSRLLYWVRLSDDEYQRSQLYVGLHHYQRDMGKLSDEARNMLAEYTAEEMRRLMALDSEDTWNALEVMADVSRYFADDAVIAGLRDLLEFGRNHINYYAAGTLIACGKEIPKKVIENLARDLEYANLTYLLLRKAGKEGLFPREFASEEYLAKSDLVRWLTYPTELGKVPDEIVYLGRFKKFLRKEVFHVFRFRSDSDTLDEEKKNRWLVGWSSDEGGTFSNFDDFAPFENETPERALKLIGKKLIG